MLEELSSRDGLDIAFAGRDEANLEPFLHFLCKYVADPRFAGSFPFRFNTANAYSLIFALSSVLSADHDEIFVLIILQGCSLMFATRCLICISGNYALATKP